MTTSVPTRAPARRLAGRAGAVGLAVLAATVLGAGPAGAADTVTIPLDPPDALVVLLPTENLGDLNEAPADEWAPTPVPVQYGGSVVVELPEPLDAGPAPLVTLDVGAEDDEEPQRSYSSDPAAGDPLGVTSLGDGAYEVTVPADDGSGDFALLALEDVVAEGVDDVEVFPVFYILRLDAAGPSSQTLAPQVLALSSPSCSLTTGDCAPYRVTAGDSLELTVPAISRLRALGLGTLTDVQAVLEPIDEPTGGAHEAATSDETAVLAAAAGTGTVTPQLAAGLLAWDQVLTGTGAIEAPTFAAAAGAGTSTRVAEAMTETTVGGLLVPEISSLPVESTEPYRATVTVPAGTAAGSYLLTLTEIDSDTGSTSVMFLLLDVAAEPVAEPVAAPEAVTEGSGTPTVMVNPGLRSNTGAEPVALGGPGQEVSPAVFAGAGLLVAGIGGGAVLRARRHRTAGS